MSDLFDKPAALSPLSDVSDLFETPAPLPSTPHEVSRLLFDKPKFGADSVNVSDLFDQNPHSSVKIIEDNITPDEQIKAAPVAGSVFPSGTPQYDARAGEPLREGRHYRVKLRVDKTDTPETVLRKGLIASAQAVGLRGTAEVAADEMYADLTTRGVTGARHAGTDTPISSDDVSLLQRDGETTFDLSDDPRLIQILNKYITSGQSGEMFDEDANATINHRNLARYLKDKPLAQGLTSGMASVDRTLGNAAEMVGVPKADEFVKDAKQGSEIAAHVAREDPDQSFSANLKRGVGEAIPKTAEMMSLQQTKVPLVISGALNRLDEGRGAAVQGAVEGGLMQAGMKVGPALGIGRVGNAALWTVVPATIAINQGESPSKAFASALPYGVMALNEGARRRESPLTLGEFINSAPSAHVERANPDAPLGYEENGDGTVSFFVEATDGSGRLKVTARPEADRSVSLSPEAQTVPKENPAPETQGSIAAQMEALTAGRRPAVLITPGSPAPEVPQGFESVQTDKGLFIFDPEQVNPNYVRWLAMNDRHGELLGHVEPKSEKTGSSVTNPTTGLVDEKQTALRDLTDAFSAADSEAVNEAYERARAQGATDAEIHAAIGGAKADPPSLVRRAGRTALDVWNATRSIKTSFDFSAPRNSLILTLTHPLKAARAFGQSVKAFGSESTAQKYRDAMESDPLKKVADESGLDMTDSSGPMSRQEEQFGSALAEKVPGVKASERAFHQYLNSMRFSVFSSYALTHPAATPEDLQGVARAINFFTGRGTFGPLENTKAMQGLSTAFYAPRLTVSYVESLATPFIGTPAARRFAARHIVQAVGTGLALGAMVKLTSKQTGVDFEADPRSSDFGKLKSGDYRINLFGGYSALARYSAQARKGDCCPSRYSRKYSCFWQRWT